MNHIFKLLFLVFTFAASAQQSNVFLDRAFWEENPDLTVVKQKIAEGNDATALNENAFDAVIYATLAKADDKTIEYLLSLDGNNVNKVTHDSRIYLHWAAYAGKTEIMKTLLKLGSEVSAKDSRGNTPATFAASSGQTNTEVYEILSENGINLATEKNSDGANVLLLLAPSFESEKDFSYYAKKGITVNSVDNEGNGIFNYAAKKGNIKLLQSLIDKGVDYKKLNKIGGNAFIFAAQGARGHSNNLEVYQYLKSIGLKPNIVTTEGNTPLHYLANNNSDPAIFNFFMEAGADVNQKNSAGNTPFLNAASRNKLEIVKLLASKVTDFNTTNSNGQSALMLAVWKNNPEVVSYLLDKDVNALSKDNDGNTAAYYLAESFEAKKATEFSEKLKLLQNKGLKLNAEQAEGNTLYHIAAKNNDLELMKTISKLEIPVNAVNTEGLTALHQAAMKANNDDMMKYLISIGADINAKTNFEETAYDLASENELLKKNNVELKFLK